MKGISLGPLKKYLLPIFCILLLLFGCSQKSALQSKGEGTAAISSTTPAPTKDAQLADSFCEWPPTQVVSKAVHQFYWVEDSTSIIFQAQGEDPKWYVYDLLKDHL